VLFAADVPPGTHVTSLGADEVGKTELAADLLRASRVFVDDLALSEEMGALGNAGLTREHAAGTITDVLTDRAGRVSEEDVTVYAPVGLPWQDLALAWTAYGTATTDTTRHFDFLT